MTNFKSGDIVRVKTHIVDVNTKVSEVVPPYAVGFKFEIHSVSLNSTIPVCCYPKDSNGNAMRGVYENYLELVQQEIIFPIHN